MNSAFARASAACAAAAIALVATPAVTTARTAPSPGPSGPARAVAETGAGLSASAAARRAAESPRPSAAGSDRLTVAPAPAARLSAAAAADCSAIGLTENLSHDPQVTVSWSDTSFGPYRLDRQRDGGTWKTVATGLTGTSFRDTGIDTHGLFGYRLVAADGTPCESVVPLSMSTYDGWGLVEAVTGTYDDGLQAPGAMMLQDEYALADDTTLQGVDPAFSPDGRLVASSVGDGAGHLALAVSNVTTRLRERLVPRSSPAVDALDAEWSPDGTRVAYTEYTADGTSLWVLDVRTGARTVVAGSAGLVQPDWRSASSLVAASAGAAGPLVTIPAAGGTPVPVAGTDGARDPEVEGAALRIWFTTDDGTTSALKVLIPSANNQVVAHHESTSTIYGQIRFSQTADHSTRIFWVEVDTAGTRNDPSDDTFTIVEEPASGTPDATPLGAPRDGNRAFWGFDVRRQLSKGTSQLALDGNSDVLALDSKGGLYTYPVTDTAQLGPRLLTGTGFGIYDAVLVAGDLNGDDTADLLCRDAAGVLWLYPGRGAGKVGARARLGSGWGSYLLVDTGDWNGDGRADLVARDRAGVLWLYPGTGFGGLRARVKIGSSWLSMDSVFGGGDFDLDGTADILAREKATGYLWLYPGNGRGGFRARVKIGNGWGKFTQLTSPELIGVSPVVYAKDATGKVWMFVGTGDGRFDNGATVVVGTGFGTYRIAS
ncbi:FG-GAP repeat domain-containing protein [Phycicoccus duodecadis]|uniref:VCBS repeat protein n=1 Tax=Phycicoccus duodecadis TaxID=173053 RepID=A0A2N3YK55_9MICO|nr:VCBS repeat-containing protein [Phycicoccus duodecadis]PKW27237.1 VCBS repeat protein [Phycicoccus duodecadis]